jgi:hypothetical protein
MPARRSYLQRLAASLSPPGDSPALTPLAQAAPGEARPEATGQLPAPAPVIRRASVAAPNPKAAARKAIADSADLQAGKAPPVTKETASAPRRATQPGAASPNPKRISLVPPMTTMAAAPPEAFPDTVAAPPAAPPASFPPFETPEPRPETSSAALPFTRSATTQLIWGEPVILPPKSSAAPPLKSTPSAPFDLPAPPGLPAKTASTGIGIGTGTGTGTGTEIHIGTIEVRTAPMAPIAPALPAPPPRAAPPAAAAPISRAYGWRFGLSQR